MAKEPIVSVVMGTYNRYEFLRRTIDTVREELKNLTHEIIVVDGGSNDETTPWLLEQKDVISIIQHNRGDWLGKPVERKSWGYFMNLGFKAGSAKYVCMVSDDCLIIPGAILNGIKLFEKKLKAGKKVGAVAFYWRNWPEQKNYWVGLSFGNRMFVNHGLYLKTALADVDFIDDSTFFFYHADGDLGLRMWEAGYETIDSPNSYIEHYSDANIEVRVSNQARQQKDWAAYTRRWGHLSKSPGRWIERPFDDAHDVADKYWSELLPKQQHESPQPKNGIRSRVEGIFK